MVGFATELKNVFTTEARERQNESLKKSEVLSNCGILVVIT